MVPFRIACLSVMIACTSVAAGHALEVTSNNEIRKLNSGLEQRLETTKSALTSAFNGLKETIDDILARLAALEAKMDKVTTRQPVDWNVPLENRLKSIEAKNTAQDANINTINNTTVNHNNRIVALENKPAGTLTYANSYSIANGKGTSTVSSGNHTLCVLTTVRLSTTEDNHGHVCAISRSGNAFVLERSGSKANTGCTMMCYN